MLLLFLSHYHIGIFKKDNKNRLKYFLKDVLGRLNCEEIQYVGN